MNAKELAERLNGREYGRRYMLDPEEMKVAKESGLVVVYGASDDLVEMEGAVRDEFGTNTLHFTKDGLLANKCDDEGCPYFEQMVEKAAPLEPRWNDSPGGPAWTFETEIPHETFDILEDGEVFCRGIVFALSDVRKKADSTSESAYLFPDPDNDLKLHSVHGSKESINALCRITMQQLTAKPTEAGTRGHWQQKCLEIGFKYWRAPDSHGVECSREQAVMFMQEILGAEVEIKDN